MVAYINILLVNGIIFIYTVIQKRLPFSHDCSFYRCWPISVIFGTQYTELMCNTIIIYLPTSPTYCCYTTLGNIGYSLKDLTGQSTRRCTKTDALSLSGCTSLIFINPGIITDGCYYHEVVRCSTCCHKFVPLRVMVMYSSKTVHQRIMHCCTVSYDCYVLMNIVSASISIICLFCKLFSSSAALDSLHICNKIK